MMALLRYLYGLRYPVDIVEWHDGQSLLPHVLMYTTAEKYQIQKLETEASFNLTTIVGNSEHDALRVIIAGTPVGDTGGREPLLACCVRDMQRLSRNTSFMAVVAEIPALGAELIRCQYADKLDGTPRAKSIRNSPPSVIRTQRRRLAIV